MVFTDKVTRLLPRLRLAQNKMLLPLFIDKVDCTMDISLRLFIVVLVLWGYDGKY